MLSIIAAQSCKILLDAVAQVLEQYERSVGGTPTILQNGDTVGAILFAAGDGTDMRTKSAQILSQVDGEPGSNDMPGRLVFSTTADGGGLTPTERVCVPSTTQDEFSVWPRCNIISKS